MILEVGRTEIGLLLYLMSTEPQSSGGKLSRNIQNGSLHAWQRILAIGWDFSWSSSVFLHVAWVSHSWAAGFWKGGSQGQALQRENRGASSGLQTWKSQDITSTIVYWSEQSPGQPAFREKGNKLHLLRWGEVCAYGDGGIDDGLWD